MASSKDATLFSSAENLFKSIKNSLDNCGNIKTTEKNNIVKCLADLKTIIDRENVLITGQKSVDVSGIETKLDSIVKVNKHLMTEIDGIKSTISTKTFSSAVYSGQQLLFGPKIPETSLKSVIVKPLNEENSTSKGTESAIKTLISKTNEKICVKNVKYISNAGIIIDCTSDEDQKKIFDAINKSTNLYQAQKPKEKWPKIAIFNVSTDIDETNIIEGIVDNNSEIKSFLEDNNEDIDHHLKCKFKFRRNANQLTQSFGSKGNTWVLEVSPKLFKIMSSKRSISMAWRSYRFSEYIDLRRCFRCCAYGHIAANCKATNSACGLCAGHHETKDCPKTNQNKCVNCLKHNHSKHAKRQLDINHTAFSHNCESLKRIQNIIHSKISYE